MKRNNKFLVKFLCLVVFIGTTVSATSSAQNSRTAKDLTRYEVAVDLQNLFSDGIPDKVLFKLNNIKNNQIIGAYRFGIGTSYSVSKYSVTHDDENYELTGKEQKTNFSISLGYEFQNKFNKAVFYYGADAGAYLGIIDDMDYPKTDDYYNISFVPFVGVKVLLSSNLSIAFETGIENKFERWKTEGTNVDPNNRVRHTYYHSRIQLPYSLTFNFNF
ncbi:hypothetical protein [Maribellus sediminis]|uniref:hypothetical protein n=1 Tax=Maribellus sediminis TaxID=2696285 RepID=UPI00142FE5B5|nr:hypothetical protein [Maribellus sediminis]